MDGPLGTNSPDWRKASLMKTVQIFALSRLWWCNCCVSLLSSQFLQSHPCTPLKGIHFGLQKLWPMALTTIDNSSNHYYKLYSTYILVIKSQNYNTGHRHNSWSRLKMSLRYSSWKLTLCSEKFIFWEAVLHLVFPSTIWQCLLCFETIPVKSPFIANAFTRIIGRAVKNRWPPFLSNKGLSWTWRWLFFNFPLKSIARLNSR